MSLIVNLAFKDFEQELTQGVRTERIAEYVLYVSN